MSTNTLIYRTVDGREDSAIGFVDAAGQIYRLRWGEGVLVGRVSRDGHLFCKTAFDERELGTFTVDGRVRSHGLFEGGELGWVDPDGVVSRGGLILGEDEVGRVEGPAVAAAAAALLLFFLPEEAELARRTR